MDTRYQIFVSSTYDDLIKEREEVTKTILTMGHIPVGMEMFSAADEEQWETIQREIDRSDYYVLIIAHRYGSTIPELEGISYTEREYNYAASINVPRIGFVIKTSAPWNPQYIDGGEAKERLDAFKAKVKGRPVDFWTDATHLGSRVSMALSKAFNVSPRPGWGRNTEDSARALSTITFLTDENRSMRAELERLRVLTSERVPQLDCQLLEEGTPVGREITFTGTPGQPLAWYGQSLLLEINGLVAQLDALFAAPTTKNPSALDLISALDMPPITLTVLEGLSQPYVLDDKRVTAVLQGLEQVDAHQPALRWHFQDLKASNLISPRLGMTSTAQVEPMGGADMARYRVFKDLERHLKNFDETAKQQQYLSNHIKVNLELSNTSALSAEDLTLRFEFPPGTRFGMVPLDKVKRRPVSQPAVNIMETIALLPARDHVRLDPFLLTWDNMPERIEIILRITGRNLPEPQIIPLRVVRAERQ